jgi:hypothetical protein
MSSPRRGIESALIITETMNRRSSTHIVDELENWMKRSFTRHRLAAPIRDRPHRSVLESLGSRRRILARMKKCNTRAIGGLRRLTNRETKASLQ